MTAIMAAGAMAGATWGAVYMLRGSLLAGCLVVVLAACCFSHPFLEFDLGPLPLTLDRLAVGGLLLAYIVQRGLGRTSVGPLRRGDVLLVALLAVFSASLVLMGGEIRRPGDISPVWRLAFAYLMPAAVYWVARHAPLTPGAVARTHLAMACFAAYLAVTGLAEVAGQWWLVFPKYIADPAVGIHFGRARGPMVQAACFGSMLMVCLLAAWARLAGGSRLERLAVLVLGLVGGGAVYFSYTRSSWAAAGLGIFVMLALSLRGPWRALALGTMLFAALAVGISRWDSLIGFQREQSAYETRKSAEMRASFAYVSWQMFLDRPVWGCGFGEYRREAENYLADRSTELHLESIRGYVHHNTLLGILVENGLLGLGLFLGLLLEWGRAAWRVYRNSGVSSPGRAHAALMLAALAVYLCQAVWHDLTYTGLENLVLFLLAGMTVGLDEACRAELQAATARR